ncbi:uncharacterized protein LOC143099496 [Alosa pseudoharengus]|uniref:uncharacterized protein LOC143099496 n=1 Tax=Alosa pseudoharengus TaxID=34774 RepID=UPI003F8B3E87
MKAFVKNVTRSLLEFNTSIGSAFDSQSAQDELRSIASSPESDHVFRVEFEKLDNISSRLKKSIMAIEDSSPLRCPPPTFNYTLNDLVFVPEPMSWVGALHHCAERGSRLVHILDNCTQFLVEELLMEVATCRGCVEKAWVGLERCMINPQAPWEWSGGAAVGDYKRWNTSFPRNPCCFHCGQLVQEGGDQDQDHQKYLWQDACCQEQLPFICQLTSPVNDIQP